MISFASDYLEGCLPDVLERLTETNLEQTIGYGEDHYAEDARRLMQNLLGSDDADIHFVVGGTMANAMVMRQILRPHQGVLAAESGHIAVHEAGAIEAGGHKVLCLDAPDGKIRPAQIEAAVLAHRNDAAREHIVQPGLVYISQPTECGTLYAKEELTALKAVCSRYGLPLYIDGARLAYALAADRGFVIADYRHRCDVLTIGGTKCGLLMGEAICFFNTALAADFRYVMKQSGGMLAKGRLLGLQFLTLFADDLYLRAAAHALAMADRIRNAFRRNGIPFAYETAANQIFPILNDGQKAKLEAQFAFELWQPLPENRSIVRFCTSWATRETSVQALETVLDGASDTQL